MLHQRSQTHGFRPSEITEADFTSVEHTDTVFFFPTTLHLNPTWKFLVGWVSDFNQSEEIIGPRQIDIWDSFGSSNMIVATVKAASSFSVITSLPKDSVGDDLVLGLWF